MAMRRSYKTYIILLSLLALLPIAGCGGAMGDVILGLAYDELMSVETSRITVENVAGVLYLHEGDTYQLEIMHRQLLDNDYGRTYYEEYVTAECSYYTSSPLIVSIDSNGRLTAVGKGTANITAKFDLPLQKADQAHLTVVVE
jgi:hypothetical protein